MTGDHNAGESSWDIQLFDQPSVSRKMKHIFHTPFLFQVTIRGLVRIKISKAEGASAFVSTECVHIHIVQNTITVRDEKI